MNRTSQKSRDYRVTLGDPVPFEHLPERELLLASALGAQVGSRDPVDLVLLSAAAKHEDLRHYRQLAFEPPDDTSRRSISRIRQLDSGEETLIARGALDAILYLCRADPAIRQRAITLAGIEEEHGYRPVAVARAVTGVAGETWQFLGFIPVRASRERPRRHEEPSAFRYVEVWDWQLRVLHWTAVAIILTLCLTGWMMGSGRLAWVGVQSDPYFIGYVRLTHFGAGWVLVACAVLRLAGLFYASTKYQRLRALFPFTLHELLNLVKVARNYLFCVFDRGPHYIGHNPLQQLAYTGIYLLGLLAIVTGLALLGLYDSDHWLLRWFQWPNDLIGAQHVRLIHLLMMWVFLAFVPIHIYLAVRSDNVELEGAISSIFSGGRWCRKGTHFEDD